MALSATVQQRSSMVATPVSGCPRSAGLCDASAPGTASILAAEVSATVQDVFTSDTSPARSPRPDASVHVVADSDSPQPLIAGSASPTLLDSSSHDSDAVDALSAGGGATSVGRAALDTFEHGGRCELAGSCFMAGDAEGSAALLGPHSSVAPEAAASSGVAGTRVVEQPPLVFRRAPGHGRAFRWPTAAEQHALLPGSSTDMLASIARSDAATAAGSSAVANVRPNRKSDPFDVLW